MMDLDMTNSVTYNRMNEVKSTIIWGMLHYCHTGTKYQLRFMHIAIEGWY
jgi:hypothetical protein